MNAKVWVTQEILNFLGIDRELVSDDMAILIENGSVLGLYCSTGKLENIHQSSDEILELAKINKLAIERI